jgi:hypothetical protein
MREKFTKYKAFLEEKNAKKKAFEGGKVGNQLHFTVEEPELQREEGAPVSSEVKLKSAEMGSLMVITTSF